jgi:hypothetical protein
MVEQLMKFNNCKQDKRPIIDAGKIIQNAYTEVFNPLIDAISRKKG